MNEPYFRPLDKVINEEDIPEDLTKEDIINYVGNIEFLKFKRGEDFFASVRKFKDRNNEQV